MNNFVYESEMRAALSAERERCAKIAEHFFQTEFKRTGEADAPVYRMQTISICIAKAIREQK